MTRPSAPARPCRPLARRGAALAAAAVLAVLAVLAIAAHAPRAVPDASRARPAAAAMAVKAVAVTRPVTAGPAAREARLAAAAAASSSCGLLDVSCHVTTAITGWFAGLITSAVNPLVNFIGSSALSTPQPSSVPAVHSLWQASLAIADACYGLLIVIGGIIVMSHQTLQTSYAAKEIAPRLVTGFIAANLSMVLMTRAVSLSNGISAALAGGGDVSQQAAARQLVSTLAASAQADHGVFLILLELAGVVLALVLAAVYVIRMMAVVLLAAVGPLLLALWALPQTAWAARWYCRAGVAVLAIPAAQGLVLSAAVRVFFAPGWLPGPGGYLEHVLVTLCLLYIMMRIPFWIGRPVLSPFGSSPARRAVRFAFTAAVLSRVAPALSGRRARPAAGATARPGRGAPPGRGPGGTGRPGLRPAQGGPPPAPGSPPRPRPRHAAPPPLPDGGSGYRGRHEAPPPLPADVRPQRRPPPAAPPLPVTRPRHAAPPPLPARRRRHASPPLPSSAVPPPAPPARPPRRPS